MAFATIPANIGDTTQLRKFGHSDGIGAAEETVWDGGTTYTFLTAATTLSLSSTSTKDTGAGAGARTVQVYGHTSDNVEQDEILTLNGVTPVYTATKYLRVHRMIVRSAGTGTANDGTVWAGTGTVGTSGVPANKFAAALAGNNQTLMALWTVPAGKTGYMEDFYAATYSNKATLVRLRVRPPGEVFQTKKMILIDNNVEQIKLHEKPVSEKSDIKITAMAAGGGGDVSAGFNLWYE